MKEETQISSEDSATQIHWGDLPLDIFYVVFSFLPMLPHYFKFARVNRSWKEILQYLMEKELDDPNYYLHLNFSFINPNKMNYTDMLKILKTCRAVKRITLSNMIVTTEMIKAISLTTVEVLVFSQCEFRSNLLSSFDYTIDFSFDRITPEKKETPVICDNHRYGYRISKTKQKLMNTNNNAYNQWFENRTSDITSQFERLRLFLFFDCKGCDISCANHLAALTPATDIDKLAGPDLINPSDFIIQLVSKEKWEKKAFVVSFAFRQFSKMYVEKQIIPTVRIKKENIVSFLKSNDLIEAFDAEELLIDISLFNFLEGYTSGLFKLYLNGQSILLKKLDELEEFAPSLDPEYVESFNKAKFVGSPQFQFVCGLLNFIHSSPEKQKDLLENMTLFKACLKICKSLDKRFKYYQSKTKSKEKFILWAHYLETGAPIKSNKRPTTSGESSTNSRRKCSAAFP